MIDLNALIAQLQAAGGSPEAVDQLQAALSSGSVSTGNLSQETRDSIERAASAMQAGDYNAAKRAAEQLMGTPDGARLTHTVLNMLGK